MEFPQINKYESLIQKHLKPIFQPIYAFSFDMNPLPKENMDEILNNIEEINSARSYQVRNIHEQQNTMSSSKVNSNISSEETLSCDKELQTYNSQKVRNKKKEGKSLIFAQQNFNKNKDSKNGTKQIKVYYFNLPNSKLIYYDKNTTVEHLINQSINLYLQDKQLDSSRIKDRGYKNFQMRMIQSQTNHKADMSIEPLSYSRLIDQGIFQALVIVQKQSLKKKISKGDSFQYLKQSNNKNAVSIRLYNQQGQKLGFIELDKNDSLEKIFNHIELNDLHEMRNYYLTENENDQDELPSDFQIKNLQSNKIYIKSKRYIDQTEFENDHKSKIIRSLTIFKEKEEEKEQIVPILPISLSEASLYQEFKVIKVNRIGVEQQRIIGIDQSKLYNYDRSVRQENKETNFFKKFFGINESTGTKRPYRFIRDIIELKNVQGGFIITFSDKTIKYRVHNLQTRDKINRKLTYLINLAFQQKRKEKIKY